MKQKTSPRAKSFPPKIGSPGYHILLACAAMFVLGLLAAVSAAYMNFSIGFFVGGQVRAGILGSSTRRSWWTGCNWRFRPAMR
ncbi:MAG TPA: hypothetical protein VH619_05760 [Verrucomicrobiae bacterium]|jgi:hypothetical protein|nr:hypothetical protein [Verrucomicrobiae bacterium]